MNNFVKVKEGTIEIEHNSTASLILIRITHREPTEDGGCEDITKEEWLSYEQFSDLKKAIDKIG